MPCLAPGEGDENGGPYLAKQWFSAFLMLRHFNTVLHGVVTPNCEILSVATSEL